MRLFAKQLCEKLSINPNIILKKPIRGLKGFTSFELLEALISTNSLDEAAKKLGYTVNPIKLAVRELLHPIFPNRKGAFASGFSARSWKLTLLSEIGLKQCCCCGNISSETDFKARAKNTDGIGSECRHCIRAKKLQDKHYIFERTPEWSDLGLIAEFYRNCPKGYHVDHIIPLRGLVVCGLHVIENLQYLPAKENIAKNNRFDIELFNS